MDLLVVEPLEAGVMEWLESRHAVRFAPELANEPRALRQALSKVRALIAPPSVALDAQGNLNTSSSFSFSFSDPGAGARLSAAMCNTVLTGAAAGTCSVTLTATAAGIYDVTATLDGAQVGGSNPVTAVFVPGPVSAAALAGADAATLPPEAMPDYLKAVFQLASQHISGHSPR